jgi:phosphate starvation-inducible protein PhoH
VGKKIKKDVVTGPVLPTLKRIKPVTIHQNEAFKGFHLKENLCLHGAAGSGKTYIALYLALNKVLSEDSVFDKVIIIRSVVPTREIGFLPGSVKEKIEIYESPYREICDEIFETYTHSYEMMKSVKKIEFQTTSHLRGLTFNNAIVIVDEMQNMSYQELATTITRAGLNCYYIYCGDTPQTDLKPYERDGIKSFLDIIRNMPSFRTVEFDFNDIVRGGLVKEFLTEEHAYHNSLQTSHA